MLSFHLLLGLCLSLGLKNKENKLLPSLDLLTPVVFERTSRLMLYPHILGTDRRLTSSPTSMMSQRARNGKL